MKIICFFLFLFLQISNNLYADLCMPSFQHDTLSSKAIFIGKLVNIGYNNYWDFTYLKSKKIFTFIISQSFKGLENHQSYISIISPVGGCCSPRFYKDSTYLVFAYNYYDYCLYTNDCTNTGLLSRQKNLIKLLKKPTIHTISSHHFDIIKSEEEFLDSIKVENKNLQMQLKTFKAQVTEQQYFL